MESETIAADNTKHKYLNKEKGVTEAQALLSGKDHLCFDVDKFVATEFQVDRFVSECKDRVSLLKLREDLETHYKNIRVALIDLINQDYADFVNLSSNLVGMEKSIEHLRQPLGQLREEIGVSKKGLNDELSLIESKLNHRKEVREKKTKLHHLINVVNSVEKIEKILFSKSGSVEMEIYMEGNRESMGHFLERVAGEFNQLQFHVNQSKGHPIIDKVKSRVSLITSKLQESLEKSFLEGLSSNQSDLVLRCLRTYALIDKTGHAEDLFRHNFVKPRMEELINEDAYSRKGLESICDDIIRFIRSDCQMVVKLTTEKSPSVSKQEKEDFVKGFDFLVNTVWPEVDDAFETKFSFIFSPGNPDLFFERYNIVMKFLDKFEECCTSIESFQKLRAHSSYQTFMAKWSLPVYFQIRFQEIGGKVENAIEAPFEKSSEESTESFSTNLITTVWEELNKCWDDKVFLQPLLSRFWKLFLQILSRLTLALKSISEEVISSKDQPSDSEETTSSSLKSVAKYNLIDLGKLYGDIFKLNSKVGDLFKTKIALLLKLVCDSSYEQHKDAFTDAMDGFKLHLDVLSNHFIKSLSDEGSQQLENTKNIPRLYRRTNRDPPSQASAYVTLAFSPLKSFGEDVSACLDKKELDAILQQTVFVMTARYYIIVDELVASIKKTEESLQRLKRLRKGADVAAQSSSNDVSDENKIRKQLLLDVQHFGKEASSIVDIEMEDHPEYNTLLELVINVNK